MADIPESFNNLIQILEINSSNFTYDKTSFHLNYEFSEYRQVDLIKLLRRTIFRYSLTKEEYDKYIENPDQDDFQELAWSRIADANLNAKGDYGEFLLWLLLENHFKAPKLLTKVRIKTSLSKQINGFDCVNVTLDGDRYNFWLGESKFRDKFYKTTFDEALSFLSEKNFKSIKNEFVILNSHLSNEFSNSDLSYENLIKKINSGSTLDDFDFTFPFLFTYDSKIINSHGEISEVFLKELKDELINKFKVVDDNFNLQLPSNFKLIFIIFPFKSVSDFKQKLDNLERGIKLK